MKRQRIKRNVDVLFRLKRARKLAVQKQMLKDCDKKFIVCIIETVFNLLNNKIPIKECYRKKLCRHSRILRKVSKIRNENTGRKVLIQKGGSLIPLLVGPILAVISAIVSEIK